MSVLCVCFEGWLVAVGVGVFTVGATRSQSAGSFFRVSWSQSAICGVPVWRSLVHGLGLYISVEIEVRFRESIFLRSVGTCTDIATFRWHVPWTFRHG